MQRVYDVIIVGSGPAGLSAAIYAQRAGLDTLIIERNGMSGGQVLTTYEVDNYPGLPGISGFDLGTKMREHADRLDAIFTEGEVSDIITEGNYKKVVTDSGNFAARTVVLAMGASHAKLGVPGEEELAGMGVSYCATCDGAFFRDKTVAVIGGGDVAAEDAIFLTRFCKKVYLIHRRDSLRAANILQDSLKKLPNVEILWDTLITAIEGEEQVSALKIKNKLTGEKSTLPVQGAFIAVGIRPNTEWMGGLLQSDESGYIKAEEDGETSEPGIFACGDIRTKQLRQIVTAVADGANVITSIQKYLIEIKN